MIPSPKRNPMKNQPFDHVWFWRARLPERKGQRCRVLARGKMNSILVEFEDGYRTLTSRYAVRRDKSIHLPVYGEISGV